MPYQAVLSTLGAAVLLLANTPAFSEQLTPSWVLSDARPAAQEARKSGKPELASARTIDPTENVYDLPNLTLTDQNGAAVNFREVVNYGGPVMLQFIFATCSSICPVLSASFASAQASLDGMKTPYRFVSVSIDPEQDTPETLAAYAERFKAGANWYFMTGPTEDISTVLKAFDATYPGGNKMYHKPLTFMRAQVKAPWLRVERMLSKNDIIAAYQKLIESSSSQ